MSIQDPADIVFRERSEVRPRRKVTSSSQAGWLVLVLVGSLVFVLLMRELLDSTEATAGAARSTAAAQQQSNAGLQALTEPEAATQRSREVVRSTAEVQTTAQSSMVYRCVSRNGEVSFQSEPCAPDQKTTRAIHAPPELVRRTPTYSQPAGPQTRMNSYTYPSVAQTERDRRARQCERAKQEREATLARIGLARTYDLLQRLDAMVNEACGL
jgi:hypothetical protein